jgi:hypothetical protein
VKQPTCPNTTTINGSFKPREFSARIDAHTAKMLSTDVYRRPFEAVVREYYCNAWDAHKKAGNPNPPKVHLPNELEPFFAVYDNGTGMPFDECEERFSTFGSSDKRESNEEIGFFGIGSKCGFAIANAFTVECRYNGGKRTYSCFKNNGMPSITELTRESTDEPNGMTVIVPTHRVREFKEAATKVFSYFEQKPEINAELDYKNIEDCGEYLFSKGHETGVVMGNVFYETYINDCPDGVILKANIGDVSIVPGRESLQLDDHTKEWIKNQTEKVVDIFVESTQAKIDKASCFFDAWLMTHEVAYNLRNKFNYKGRKFLTANAPYVSFIAGSSWSNKNQHGSDNRYYSSSTEFFWAGKKKMRVGDYVRGKTKRAYLVTEEDLDKIGITKDMVKDPNDLPKRERNSTRSVTHKIFVWKGGWVPADLPEGKFAYVKIHQGRMEDFSCSPRFDFPVYGLTRQARNIKKVMKNAVPLQEKLPQSQNVVSIPADPETDLIKRFFPDFAQKCKDAEVDLKTKNLQRLYQNFGVTTKVDYSLVEEQRKILEEYPIIKMARYVPSRHSDIIEHYLSMEKEVKS